MLDKSEVFGLAAVEKVQKTRRGVPGKMKKGSRDYVQRRDVGAKVW